GELVGASAACPLIGQALRTLCGIRASDSIDARRDALCARVAARLPVSEAERSVVFIGELCGVPFPDDADGWLREARRDPRTMGNQTQQALIRFLRAECAHSPVLLVLEDLHWGDARTVQMVEAALAALKEQPFMVLAFARPEVMESFPRLWPR